MTSENAYSADLVDLVVVGAGPAGMAAAVTALAGGLTVHLLDSGVEVGGQFWRHPPRGAGPGPTQAHHHNLKTYRALRRHLDHYLAVGRLRVGLQHHVWSAERFEASNSAGEGTRITLHVIDRSAGAGAARAAQISGRAVAVATGAFDRPLPFEGWELPGVYTAGALQALLKSNGVVAGQRVVLSGTGPFLLPVAADLARAGARVVAVCEAGAYTRWATKWPVAAGVPSKLAEGASYAMRMARHRVPLLPRTAVVAAHGASGVESVRLAQLDKDGRIRAGRHRDVPVDVVGIGWGFVPRLDLALTLGCALRSDSDRNQVLAVDDSGRTSVAGVYAAGEVSGVGGAELALREGQLVGEAVLADAGLAACVEPERITRIRWAVARHRGFAAAMHTSHPLPQAWSSWLPDSTTVCRCEEVDAGRVRGVVAAGALDVRQVKQLTRAGMGWCQGRMCAAAVDCLVHEAAPASPRGAIQAVERLVADPVPLGALAGIGPSHEDQRTVDEQ